MPLFDRYLFADYSGGGENHQAQADIRLYRCLGNGEPERLLHTVINCQTNQPQNFSRDSLRERVQLELRLASQQGHRVIFGFDHQYAWPTHLRRFAGIADLAWRDALMVLHAGDPDTGLPTLDIPKRYCAAFNQFCGNNVFWSRVPDFAVKYTISQMPLGIPPTTRFRLTELMAPIQGNAEPCPADEIGGRGAVAGQTICGIYQISQMFGDRTTAWWPFDGFDIANGAYQGKHVGVEIYPSALRPFDVTQDDDNDAYHSCLYVRDADHDGRLGERLTLAPPEHLWSQIEKEGWIVGMNPEGLFAYGGPTFEELLKRLTESEHRIWELERQLMEFGNVAEH